SPFLSNQRWGYGGVIIVFVATTISAFISPPAVVGGSGLRLWAIDYGLAGALMTVSVWAVVRSKHRHPWRALGLDPSSALCNALWALRIGLGVISVFTVTVVLLRVGTDVGTKASSVHGGAWRTHFLDFIAAFVVLSLLIPMAEELIFRSMAYGPLFRRFGPIGAALGTAFFWAAVHYSGPSIASTFKMASV